MELRIKPNEFAFKQINFTAFKSDNILLIKRRTPKNDMSGSITKQNIDNYFFTNYYSKKNIDDLPKQATDNFSKFIIIFKSYVIKYVFALKLPSLHVKSLINNKQKAFSDAYTNLARKIMSVSPNDAVMFARMAWLIHPQSYRLKWLAFRIADSGDMLESAILLRLLPKNTKINPAEKKKIAMIFKYTKIII